MRTSVLNEDQKEGSVYFPVLYRSACHLGSSAAAGDMTKFCCGGLDAAKSMGLDMAKSMGLDAAKS